MNEGERIDSERGGGAESVLNLGPGCSIPIRYHPSFGSDDDLLLLEVDDQILDHALHNRVTVRGLPDDDAVLCTPAATYAMKFVGTSNTVCLIPHAPDNFYSTTSSDGNENKTSLAPEAATSVIKVVSGHIELIQTAPRLEKLKSLLQQRPYGIEDDGEDDSEGTNGLYKWEDFIHLIQASEDEVRAALRSFGAVEINGYWRTVNKKYMGQILGMILNNSILHDWLLNALPEVDILSVMEIDGFPSKLVLHCLDSYGSKFESSGRPLWRLDEKRVCIHFALQTLGVGKMKLDSFMEKWRRSIPPAMNADLKMLEGEVLYEKLGVENWIRPFSVSALPSTPAERFSALFHERQKWEWKDLEPFIRDLHVPGISSEGLLIKFTRRTQPTADAEPIFSAR